MNNSNIYNRRPRVFSPHILSLNNQDDIFNYLLFISMGAYTRHSEDPTIARSQINTRVPQVSNTATRRAKRRDKRRDKRKATRQKEIEQQNQKRTEEENRRKAVCNFLTDDVFCHYLRVQDDSIDVNRDLLYRKVAHSYRELHPYRKKKNPNAKCKGQCSICLESIHGRLQHLPCGHKFHKECIAKVRSRICPLCRETF